MKEAKPWIIGGSIVLILIGVPFVLADVARAVGVAFVLVGGIGLILILPGVGAGAGS